MDVFHHPWLSGLFRDPEISDLWSAEAQLTHMLAFEAAWSRNGHLAGLWSEENGRAAAKAIEKFVIAPTELADGTGRDGVCVPELVRRLKADVGEAVHSGSTSQDVTDTAMALTLLATAKLFIMRLSALDAALEEVVGEFGHRPMMGRTRMQAALPISVIDRVSAWRRPLAEHVQRLENLIPSIARIQIGGPVGDRAALGGDQQLFVDAVAQELGLLASQESWHSSRAGIVEFASALSLISGSLGKIGQDVALMAQQGIDEIRISGGGSSSAMPHKQNPILAELLVTLARFNAAQVAGMHATLVHEQERSGVSWTLEWMLLPQMAIAAGRSLTAALELVKSIEEVGGEG